MTNRSLCDTIEMSEDSFGHRLRAERERRRIALEAIAADTKIGIGLLQGLECDDVSRWPSGIFRRSFIRGYAEAIGLDADVTMREFLERFPDTQLSVFPAFRESGAGSRTSPPKPGLRLTLADSFAPFSGGPLLLGTRLRLAAAAWDAGSVLAVALVAFVFIDAFWMSLAGAMLCYYLGGVLLLGNTPGVCLFAPRPRNFPDSGADLYDRDAADAAVGGLGSDPAVLSPSHRQVI